VTVTSVSERSQQHVLSIAEGTIENQRFADLRPASFFTLVILVIFQPRVHALINYAIGQDDGSSMFPVT